MAAVDAEVAKMRRMEQSSERIVQQLNNVLARFMGPYETPSADRFADCSSAAVDGWIVSCQNVVDRIAPPGSRYVTRASEMGSSGFPGRTLAGLAALLQALRDDYADGLLSELTSLIHADLFDDFLEMARHLLDSGYKDPAAVLAGSVLEEHLRKLCVAHGVATVRSGEQPHKADTLNAELVKGGVYNRSQQKDVTAWLGRRNDAAHGHYDRYDDVQVGHMLEGVRGFLNRHPS